MKRSIFKHYVVRRINRKWFVLEKSTRNKTFHSTRTEAIRVANCWNEGRVTFILNTMINDHLEESFNSFRNWLNDEHKNTP